MGKPSSLPIKKFVKPSKTLEILKPCVPISDFEKEKNKGNLEFFKIAFAWNLERETGIGPATFSLARRRSTTLLLAHL